MNTASTSLKLPSTSMSTTAPNQLPISNFPPDLFDSNHTEKI